MTATLIPDTDMVLKAWIDTLDLDAGCGYSLPYVDPDADIEDTWYSTGFLMVTGVVGGQTNDYTGVQKWITTLESYAYNPKDPNPPWWMASANLQRVCMATVGRTITGTFLTLPDDYFSVRLLGVNNISGAKKKPGDQGGYAVYTADIEVIWMSLDTIIYGSNPGGGNTIPDCRPRTFVFTSSSTWTVVHNLGYYPQVQLFGEDGVEIEGQIDQTDLNTVTITFNQPVAGSAVVG